MRKFIDKYWHKTSLRSFTKKILPRKIYNILANFAFMKARLKIISSSKVNQVRDRSKISLLKHPWSKEY